MNDDGRQSTSSRVPETDYTQVHIDEQHTCDEPDTFVGNSFNELVPSVTIQGIALSERVEINVKDALQRAEFVRGNRKLAAIKFD